MFLWLLTFYQTGPNGLFIFYQVFNLILQSANEIQATINPDQLEWIDDYAIIMVVGEGMKKYHVVSRQILDSLGDHDISPRMINQGASQISMMIGTKKEKADEAVKIIYQQFFTKGENHG